MVVHDVGDFELWDPERDVPLSFGLLLPGDQAYLLQSIASEIADRCERAAESTMDQVSV